MRAERVPRLEFERIIRPAMALLEAMGAQGEAYDHHERAFRDLDSIEDVVRGARRVTDHAGRMLTRDGLAAHTRATNGLTSPEHDALAREIARKIRRLRSELLDVLEAQRRRYVARHGLAAFLKVGLVTHNGNRVDPPPGHWVDDEDQEHVAEVVPLRRQDPEP